MIDGRLFFALWPDAAVRSRLRPLLELPEARAGRRPHPDDLHLTLVFLGPVAAARQAELLAAAAAVSGRPFEVVVDRLGGFPRSRVLWAGLAALPPGLIALHADLQRALAERGFPPEARPYAPHLTLARDLRRVEPRALAEPLRWPVTEFVLATSVSGPRARAAPRYRVVARWPLSPAAGA